MKILVQPAGDKAAKRNYEKTIIQGVWIEQLKEFLSESEFDELNELNSSKIKMWGMVPTEGDSGDRKEWIELKRNDWVLFYADKKFFYVAKIHSKIHNPDLARKFWGEDSNGRTWEYIYFIKEGKEIEISSKPQILKTEQGIPYKPNFFFRGAQLLNEDNSEILKNFISETEIEITPEEIIDEDEVKPTEKEEIEVDNATPEFASSEDAELKINQISQELANKPVKERIKTAKIYSRNPKYSRWVKEKQKYVCEICGAKPFLKRDGIPYAEAHHKLEVAKNRIDNPHYMICICPTCHKVIHYGSDEALKDREKLRITTHDEK